MYKTLATQPVGSIACMDDCLAIVDRHDALKKGGSSKTIPFDRIQDVGHREAAGATVKM